MYDNINQLFSYKNKGARNLILDLYDKLQQYLSNDPHYWIQRAKAIYKMEKFRLPQMRNARIYALKAYNDSEEFTRLKTVSQFTLAKILGKISKLNRFLDSNENEEALSFYYKVLTEKYDNNIYINELITDAKKSNRSSDLKELIKYFSTQKITNYKIKECYQEIITLIASC